MSLGLWIRNPIRALQAIDSSLAFPPVERVNAGCLSLDGVNFSDYLKEYPYFLVDGVYIYKD